MEDFLIDKTKAVDFLNSIINSISDPVFVKDEEHRILLANEAFLNFLGYERSEIIGKPDKDLFPTYQTEKFHEIDKNVFKTGKELINEEDITTSEGKLMIISTKKKLFIDSDGNKFIVGVIKDLTESKKIEIDLIQATNKAMESDKLKTTFLSNISHEIRTPLNGILGFSGILKKDKYTDEEFKMYIDIIESSGKQLLNIISDILDISILETGQLKIVERPYEVDKLVEEVMFMYFPGYNKDNFYMEQSMLKYKKNLDLKVNKPSIEIGEAYIDDFRLKQVLKNLIGNAIKFTEEGFIELGYYLNNNKINIYVKDSGIGIDEVKLKSIFNSFRQTDESRQKAYGGLGIGLSISKRIIDLMGGEINVESEINLGSTFTISIPYKPYSSPQLSVLSKEEKHISNKWEKYTVLIVEDDYYNYYYLQMLLDETGINIIIAQNGEAAVNMCKSEPNIDIVLMDIKMDIMNGFEATRLIKEFKPHIPIIALTAYALEYGKVKSLEAGCDDFISKPASKETIIETMRKWLDFKL